MAHGLYNSRPIYDLNEEQERAYWQDFITHLKEMTGKRLKGRLGGGAGYMHVMPRSCSILAPATDATRSGR